MNTETIPNKQEADCFALIRQCDGCGMITAIDAESSQESRKEMEYPGQTIREVCPEEALRLWRSSGACTCEKQERDEVKCDPALEDARQLLADIANHKVNPEDEAEKWLRAYGWPRKDFEI